MTTLFKTIVADPPWKESGGGRCKRGADRHYELMSVTEIIKTILNCPLYAPADNAHLYLWATNNFLIKAGSEVMPALGFRYVTCLTWKKDRVSLGQYFRGCTEQLLFGVRGSGYEVCTERRDLNTLIEASVPKHPKGTLNAGKRIHSRKPVASYERIEARSIGPYLELFARPPARAGWVVWGNEVSNA
jgi:N6-adenosine-specific RNA methylase IME4